MDWRLNFSGLQQPVWAVSVVAAALLAAILCVWLLRTERALVSRSVGWILFALRLSVIVLLLLVLLQPTLSRREQTAEQPRFVVAVDVSGSMRTSDPHSTTVEFLRWCQALRLLNHDQAEIQIEGWIEDSNAGREPDWAAGGDETLSAEAAARERQLKQLFTDLGELTRTQLIHRLLTAGDEDLAQILNSEFDSEWRRFAVETSVPGQDQLFEDLESSAANGSAGTDLANVLDDIRTAHASGNCAGVLLFSDGRPTRGTDAVREATRLGDAGIPVYTVPVGSEYLPKDLIVQAVDAPGSVFPGDQVPVRARIAAAGFDGQSVTLQLRRGEDLIEQQEQPVQAGLVEAEFLLPELPEGYHDFTLEAEVLPGELSDENNQQQFSVAVVDNRATVMLVDQDARWEFRYLNNLFERDLRIELTTYLLDQPFLELLDRPALERNLPPPAELRAVLEETDLLLLGDVQAKAMSLDAWTAIRDAVSDNGLTLALIPGRRYAAELLSQPVTRELIPVDQLQSLRAEQVAETVAAHHLSGFQLTPTTASAGIPMFQLQLPGQDVGATFRSLAGHPWVLSGAPRPAASVWATGDLDGRRRLHSVPLIVHHYFGSGQVIWMGMDSTWRWRRRAGDAWHHRFWGQFVRWAVRNRSAHRSDRLEMHLSTDVISEQQSADVSVRWLADPADIGDRRSLHVTAVRAAPGGNREENSESSFELISRPETRDRFSGTISGLAAGRYRIRLSDDHPASDADDPVEAALTVVARASAELSDVSCSRDQLQLIADASGGEMLNPWELHRLPRILRGEADREQEDREQRQLWDHWGMLAGLLLLLMCQWIIRKQNGLP